MDKKSFKGFSVFDEPTKYSRFRSLYFEIIVSSLDHNLALATAKKIKAWLVGKNCNVKGPVDSSKDARVCFGHMSKARRLYSKTLKISSSNYSAIDSLSDCILSDLVNVQVKVSDGSKVR